jgi:hypothetical protein
MKTLTGAVVIVIAVAVVLRTRAVRAKAMRS